MPILKERQYRTLMPMTAAASGKKIESDYYTEGYATTWQRYVLWEDEKGPVCEQFTKDAFMHCDMSDIIMQYDHAGKVFARTSNKTLIVEPDDIGLFTCADLSKSEAAKELYGEISSGLVTKMSWGFLPGEFYFDEKTRTIIHTSVKKIFDVSAVSIPANDTTDIHARSFVGGVIDKRLQELHRREEIKTKIEIKLKLEDI